MAIKILIVDPSVEWLKKAESFFEENYYKVDTASNGKAAQLQVYNESYFAVILNIDTENHPAVLVLKYIRTHSNQTKIIVTINNEEGLKRNEYNLSDISKKGASKIVTAPYELIDLKNSLEAYPNYRSNNWKSTQKEKGLRGRGVSGRR